jgi:hypothetical protein
MAPNIEVPSVGERQQIAELRLRLGELASKLKEREARLAVAADSEIAEQVNAALRMSLNERKVDHWQLLDDQFSAADDFLELGQKWRTARDELRRVQQALPRVMVMRDLPETEHRPTYILDKGLYNQQRETVTADVPQVFPPLEGERPDRLSLARWLVTPEHPLTARVTVNRLWQMLFGVGLVKTTEDFGVQGDKPSHPLLLDWLACELVESGWDVKHLLRLIVTSSSYRQSASASPELRERDAENRLLARGPRGRLPSWMIRDQALFASGLLVGEVGGAPTKPYQPAGVWEEATFGNKKYVQDEGAALYRRSLYVFWRRIVGPTMFFDTAKRQTCSVKSAQTNSPLHALVTLNDVTYVEAARALAMRVMHSADRAEDRLGLAFRLATSRQPTQSELAVLLERLRMLQAHYEGNMESAREVTRIGDLPADPEADVSDLASYTGVCLLVFNLDETLNK